MHDLVILRLGCAIEMVMMLCYDLNPSLFKFSLISSSLSPRSRGCDVVMVAGVAGQCLNKLYFLVRLRFFFFFFSQVSYVVLISL